MPDEQLEISNEDLDAAADLFDDLVAGTHYSKHEQALNDMFGTNPNRRIYAD